MLKLKQWISFLIIAICFMIVSIINIVDKKYLSGIIWMVVSIINFISSIIKYREYNKSHKNKL